jgi:hypothetical protein
MQNAVQADQSVLHGDGKLDYVDNSRNQLTEVAQAAMAEDVESEDIDTTEETPENEPQSPANGTLFEDEVVTPNEEEKR